MSSVIQSNVSQSNLESTIIDIAFVNLHQMDLRSCKSCHVWSWNPQFLQEHDNHTLHHNSNLSVSVYVWTVGVKFSIWILIKIWSFFFIIWIHIEIDCIINTFIWMCVEYLIIDNNTNFIDIQFQCIISILIFVVYQKSTILYPWYTITIGRLQIREDGSSIIMLQTYSPFIPKFNLW